MKPLKLKLSAFGNYAKEQIIDFTKLNGRNLFLITGNTGAGKTTIFDAISYALYGAPSGDFRDIASLRSHYVKGDIETFVELEFQIRNRFYKIRRSPEQMLNKKRGEGYRKEITKVELIFLDSDENPITKVKDVDERIRELLGVDKDQFRQIVMLPQGEFLKLLKANSKEREEIFRKIFGTESFKKVQDDLKEKVKTLWIELKDNKNERDLYVKQLKTHRDSILFKSIENDDINIEEVVELASKQVEEDIIKREEIKFECNQLRNQNADINKKIIILENNKKIINDYEISKRKLEEHKNNIGLIKVYEEKLSKGKRAEKVKVLEDKLNNEITNMTNKKDKLSEVKKKKGETLDIFKKIEEDLDKAKDRVKEKEKLIVKLDILKKQEIAIISYLKRKEYVKDLKEQLKNKEELVEQLKVSEVKLENSIRELLDEINNAIISEGKANLIKEQGLKHRRDIEALKALKNHYEDLRQKKADYSELRKSFEKADLEFKVVKENFEQCEENFKRSQAGLLAENLVEGLPCPVCGSISHPQKAKRLKNVLSEDELKELKNQYDKEYEKKENFLRDLRKLNDEITVFYKEVIISKIKELKPIIGEGFVGLTHSEQRERITSEGLKLNDVIESEIEEYKKLEKIFLLKDKKINKKNFNEEKIKEIKEQLVKLNDFIKEHNSKLSVEEEALKNIEREVPESIRDTKLIKIEISNIERDISLIEENLSICESRFRDISNRCVELNKTEKLYEEDIINIENNINVLKEEVKKRILKESFVDYEDYKKSLVCENLDLIDRKIKSYYENLKALEALFEKDNSSVSNLEIKDMNVLEEEKIKLINIYNEIGKREEEASESFNIYNNRVEHNKKILEDIDGVRKKIGKKEKNYEKLSHLSNIANGEKGNLKKITFESYVLTAYFDEIIVRANIRLSKMTNGRFLLKRKEDLGKGNKKQGLDLEVYDNNTGRERGINSLSGGESFKTALCLALGLADVIQSYAGGISIDTMFVDEGFGTLDPQSLDSAIECLINIQQGGRLVGIISHVDELKERIDAKLEVKVIDGEGSTADFSIK